MAWRCSTPAIAPLVCRDRIGLLSCHDLRHRRTGRSNDADSHIMELPNFLIDYADAGIRDRLRPVNYDASLVTDEEVALIVDNGGRHSSEHVATQVALGDRLIAESKEIQALGAFDAADRSVGPRHARVREATRLCDTQRRDAVLQESGRQR